MATKKKKNVRRVKPVTILQDVAEELEDLLSSVIETVSDRHELGDTDDVCLARKILRESNLHAWNVSYILGRAEDCGEAVARVQEEPTRYNCEDVVLCYKLLEELLGKCFKVTPRHKRVKWGWNIDG